MREKLLPAILMSTLLFASLAMVLRGPRLALRRTAWEKSRQSNLFIRILVVVILWVALTGILAWNGFFADFSKMPPRPALTIVFPLVIF